MKRVFCSDNFQVNALGQGTWHMGMDASRAASEADALRFGIDLGMTLIDTAEMYHDAETVVGKAIAGRRDEVTLVSKVLPGNASYKGTIDACERSLQKLQTEAIDWYLLHWPGSHPLGETLEAFSTLKRQGKIRAFGVSNFDYDDMATARGLDFGEDIVTNQILYNLECRGVEWDLIPWCRQNKIPVMAYSPLNQARLNFANLKSVAARHNATPAQIALAWLLHQDQIIVIPKSGNRARVEENSKAAIIELDATDLSELDRFFPPPDHAMPLQML
ncbi:MAG: aldo/keto reductase [Pseudomonadota bacterium]